MVLINPLINGMDTQVLNQWNEIAPVVIAFLIFLLMIKELASTATYYSTINELQLTDCLQRYINIGLFPLLYIFALNVLVKIMRALFD